MLQAKYKYKDEASTCISHLPIQLVKLCRVEVLSKFDPETQELVLGIEYRFSMPLYLDEVQIEDANNVKLEWLIGIDNLLLFSEKKTFTTNIDEILVSTFSIKLFCRDKVVFDLD